jgi:hypothetical protein
MSFIESVRSKISNVAEDIKRDYQKSSAERKVERLADIAARKMTEQELRAIERKVKHDEAIRFAKEKARIETNKKLKALRTPPKPYSSPMSGNTFSFLAPQKSQKAKPQKDQKRFNVITGKYE